MKNKSASVPKGTDKNQNRGYKSKKPRKGSKTTQTTTGSTVNAKADALAGINDFSWYNRNPMLTTAAASIPFPYRPGMEIPVVETVGENTQRKFEIPGVLALDWAPTVGWSKTATDPASIAAKEIFAQVRSVFSGSIDADPPDFVIYLLALDSLFSYIGSLKRVYRTLNAYTPQNYQIPDALLRALGLTGTALQNYRTDKSLLWQHINELIGMTRKFRCPAIFDVFNRHYWMNDNVYADDATANSQLYVFRQVSFFKYALDSGSTKFGTLTPVKLEALPPTVEAAFQFGRDLVDALAAGGGDDCYIISGYLMRAFEGTPNFVVDELLPDETLTPLYVPEVLQQIENSVTIAARADSDAEFDKVIASTAVTQDPTTNAIISTPNAMHTATPAVNVSIRSEQPSVVDVVEATRLAAYLDLAESPSTNYYKIDCGTEIPLRWTYASNLNWKDNYAYSAGMKTKTGCTVIPQVVTMQVLADSATTTSVPITDLMALMVLPSFDWAPRICGLLDASAVPTAAAKFSVLAWDVHNVTAFSKEQLQQIHRICLLSEFNSFGSN